MKMKSFTVRLPLQDWKEFRQLLEKHLDWPPHPKRSDNVCANSAIHIARQKLLALAPEGK